MDEGVIPVEAFPIGYVVDPDEAESAPEATVAKEPHASHLPAFLSGFGGEAVSRRSKLVTAGVVAVIVLIVAVVGVPAGWYSKNKPAGVTTQAPSNVSPEKSDTVASEAKTPGTAESVAADSAGHNNEAALLAARREREARDRERAKAREGKSEPSSAAPKTASVPDAGADASKKQAALPAAQRKVTVQVSYDENGRVTQASGGDATALRIARQKRFPAGKPGSATVTIPIN